MMDRYRLLGGLSRALEFRLLLFMIDRLSLLGGVSMYVCIYHNDGPTSLIGGLSRAPEFKPLLFMIDRPRLLGVYQ